MRALVMAGGGMRGAYASGAGLAMQEMGLRFDAVYGTSAGGAMAAWFSAGQADDGVRTWAYATDPRVLNYRRYVTRRGPLIDLEYLYDDVYPNQVGLDVTRFSKLGHPVYVTAVDTQSADCHYLDLRRTSVLRALQATSSLPFIANGPVTLDGHSYMDGGLADPLPIRKAIEDGHTDIVAVLNRPPGPRRPEPRTAAWLFERHYPTLSRYARIHHQLCEDALRLALDPPEGVQVTVLRPESDFGVGRLTRDLERLQRALAAGADDARRALT